MDEAEIVLRAPEPKDTDLLYLWENDPEIWKVSNTIAPFSKHILEQYIETAHLDIYQVKQLRLMIDAKDADQVKTVGTIDLFDFDPFHLRAGVGILIGYKQDRHKGLASLALRKFISYGFDILQLHQLFCNITISNEESIRLFISCGFEITGRKKDWIKTLDGFEDELILQLLNPRK